MTHLLSQIHSKTSFFSGNESALREKRGRTTKFLIGLICFKIYCLKILLSRPNKNSLMKNGNEAKDVLGDSRKRYHAMGRDRKI